MSVQILLTPNFSWVLDEDAGWNRFNGFSVGGKPLKRLEILPPRITRLKPGVNQSRV